ncbi:MAG: hypothetical protein U0271_10945 [Polyangiaceae bacterium]
MLEAVTNGLPSHVLSASFFDWSGYTCTTVEEGPCTFVSCFAPAGLPVVPPFGAGTIEFSGGAQTVALTPNAQNLYSGGNDTQHYFVDGDVVTISATGDAVPAFSSTLTAPDVVNLTSDQLGAAIDSTSDLLVTWAAGPTEGSLTIMFGAYTSDATGGTSHNLTCVYDITAGSATVPAAALQLLPLGNVTFAIESIASELLMVGEWAVSTRLEAFALYDGLLSAGGTLPLQ